MLQELEWETEQKAVGAGGWFQRKRAADFSAALHSFNFLFAQPIAICQNLPDKE